MTCPRCLSPLVRVPFERNRVWCSNPKCRDQWASWPAPRQESAEEENRAVSAYG